MEKPLKTPREIVFNTSEVPGLEDYPDQSIKVRRMTYGDKAELTDAIVVIGTKEQRMRLGHLRIYALVFGVADAPFFRGQAAWNGWGNPMPVEVLNARTQAVRNLDESAGLAIFERVIEVNPRLTSGGEDTKKEFMPSSSEEGATL